MINDINSDETWRDVVGYEGLYIVSDVGNVKSLERTIVERRTGRVVRRRGKLLKPVMSLGYKTVGLGKDGAVKMLKVHRLVAMAFVPGKSKKKWMTNHKNGDRLDNRVDNLEWCSASENLAHAYKLGLKKPGVGSRNRSLNERKVRSIKTLARDGARTVDIARAHGTSTGVVRAIRNGRTYRHVIA